MLPVAETGRSQPRDRIYPHRSVRSVRVTRSRVYAGIGFAILLTALTGWFAVPLMSLHNRIAAALMEITGLPVTDHSLVAVFPGLEPALAPNMPIPVFSMVPDGARMGLIMSMIVLLIAARRFSLFRNLSYFLMLLLFLSAAVNIVFDTFLLSSATLVQIWMRQELLVWLLLPWVMLLLFVFPQPSLVRGFAWVVFLLGYGFVFSILRMVFVLGVLHYSGLLFMPVLWFVLGTLSDLLFILFFYSISVHRTAGGLWGARSAWQSQF